jgi:hypothetical protein
MGGLKKTAGATGGFQGVRGRFKRWPLLRRLSAGVQSAKNKSVRSACARM